MVVLSLSILQWVSSLIPTVEPTIEGPEDTLIRSLQLQQNFAYCSSLDKSLWLFLSPKTIIDHSNRTFFFSEENTDSTLFQFIISCCCMDRFEGVAQAIPRLCDHRPSSLHLSAHASEMHLQWQCEAVQIKRKNRSLQQPDPSGGQCRSQGGIH